VQGPESKWPPQGHTCDELTFTRPYLLKVLPPLNNA
jgi:hypothetical protein